MMTFILNAKIIIPSSENEDFDSEFREWGGLQFLMRVDVYIDSRRQLIT